MLFGAAEGSLLSEIGVVLNGLMCKLLELAEEMKLKMERWVAMVISQSTSCPVGSRASQHHLHKLRKDFSIRDCE